jgi:hypothetical protein
LPHDFKNRRHDLLSRGRNLKNRRHDLTRAGHDFFRHFKRAFQVAGSYLAAVFAFAFYGHD